MIRRVLGMLLAGLALVAALPAAGAETEDCLRLFKDKRYQEAIDCWRERIRAGDPDPEIVRVIGGAFVLLGDRPRAYHYYLAYVERCPQCRWAQQMRTALADYEEYEGYASAEDAPVMADDVKADVDAAPSSGRARATRLGLARALVDKAEALERIDSEEALALARRVAPLAGPEHPLTARARALIERLQAAARPPPRPSAP